MTGGSARVAHEHADVTGGWLRPAVFGAMDGLVSNFAFIAGVAGGGVDRSVIVLAGTGRPGGGRVQHGCG